MFAHMVGLPEKLDRLPEPRMGPKARGENDGPTLGRVQVSFKEDADNTPLQRFLLDTVKNTHEFLVWCRHLGMRKKDITCKLKYYKDAVQDPGQSVMLDSSTQRMMVARCDGKLCSQNLAYRPKPHYRTREPGVKSIIAFNLSFVLWLMYGSL